MMDQLATEHSSQQSNSAQKIKAAWLEAIFEGSPDALLLVNPSGEILAANPLTTRIFGYTLEDLLGQSVEILLPERFRKSHPSHRAHYQSNPHTRPMGANLELYAQRCDKSEFPVDIMLSPLPTNGEPIFLAVVRDITERRAMEQQLETAQQHFRAIVEGTKDYAIFMLDPTGHMMTWNPGAERIKGYRSEEILGRHFSIFYSQEDRERGKPQHEIEMALAEGRCEDEGWRIRKDGSRFWANVIITALYDSHQRLTGFSKLTRDLTERRQAEESLLAELSTSVLTRIDINKMLEAIAASVHRMVEYDDASLALLSEDDKTLQFYSLNTREETPTEQTMHVSAGASPEADVLLMQEPLYIPDIEESIYPASALERLHQAGVRAAWWIPLSSDGLSRGVLCIGVRSAHALESLNRATLSQMAAQIALMMKGVNATRQLAALADHWKEQKRYLEEELRTEYSFEEIVGQSDSLKRVLKQVETVAPTDATVMILGETGTGKELIARAIHNLSPRKDHTFVKVNCSSIPSGLLESELFGHEKGAFTGAIQQRIGRLELAHQGTLFLDEIGDLPLDLQPKLLRALQEKEIERLGGKRTIPVDFRLLAATHRDLARMVKEGQFRSDLYYRLKVFPILLPPLRQRREDIRELVNYFVAKHARRMNKHIEEIPEPTMQALTHWHWPGNIRELENFLERAVILTSGKSLRAPLSELEDLDGPSQPEQNTLESAERHHILQVLRECKGMIGGVGGAAERLGLKRTTLNSKMKKLGIERQDYQ